MAGETQRERSAAVRQAIVDTALELALAEGFEALSVRKISRAMGYTTGVLYHHFTDKDAVIREILRQQGERLQRGIAQASAGALTVEAALRANYSYVFSLAREQPHLYGLLARRFLQERASAPLRALESALKAAYGGAEIDFFGLAHAIWTSFIGFHLSIAQGPALTAEAAEALFEAQLRLIFHGLPRTASPPGGDGAEGIRREEEKA